MFGQNKFRLRQILNHINFNYENRLKELFPNSGEKLNIFNILLMF